MAAENVEIPYSENKNRAKKLVYECINDNVLRGDVVFLVSDDSSHTKFPKLRSIHRLWIGLSKNDKTAWHTTVGADKEKKGNGAIIRPTIVHSGRMGVEKIHIPPSYFSSQFRERSMLSHSWLEVVCLPELSDKQRREIVNFTNSKIGQPFQGLGWRHDLLPYVFGFRAPKIEDSKSSCHGLIYSAYDYVGVKFPHQLENTPLFNVGRLLGHVIGEDSNYVDVNHLYLHDHHLYRDPRFESKLSIHENKVSKNISIQINGLKYSWDEQLQKDYKII